MIRASLFRFPSLVTFLGSITVGVLLALVVREYRVMSENLLQLPKIPHSVTYRNWILSHNISLDSMTHSGKMLMVNEASFLKKNVRLLCFVMPQSSVSSSFLNSFNANENPDPSFDAATAIMKIWGRRCNKMVFFGRSPRVRPAGVSVLVIKSQLAKSWSAMREAIVQIAINYQNSYDWFLQVELETYVIIENLRYYLAIFDPMQPHYFGHIYDSWGMQYNGGTAGFVFSRGTLRKLHNALIKGHCESSTRPGDMMLGSCLSEIGIVPLDTRDSRNRGRFLALDPEDHLLPQSSAWFNSFRQSSRYQIREGPDCCSDYAVTFHADAINIHVLEYLIYHLKPYGISTSISGNEKGHLLTKTHLMIGQHSG